MMPYGPAPWGWGWMLGGWLAMLVFWSLVIAGIVILVRTIGHRGTVGQPNADDEALAILRRRYAAGEITKEQFEEMKQTLERGRAA